MKFKVTILLLLLLPIFLFGETISYSVPKPEIIEGKFENELPKILEAGNPQLPYIPLKILLPMGHKIRELELSFGKELQKEEVNIKPAAQMQPISKPNLIAEPQTNVYQKNEDFPKKDYDFLGTQSYRGYNIALVNVYPYKYNPQQQKLKYLEEFVLTWTSSYEEDLAAEQLRKVDMNRGKLRRLDLENISAAASYKSKPVRSRNLPIPEDPYTMIIITNQESEPYFEDFINWKEDNGVHTGIFVTENIYASYSGVDNQEKIRNFIIDAYETYNSTSYPLEYVILGGDDEIIPIRGCYGQVGGTVDYNIPTDMYYGSLDGSWDADGDGIYGEQNDNVDLFPEVAVGRISAETEHEFDNFFNKNYSYVDEPVVSNDISLMIGENLDDNPTWGGDYKDQVLADCSLQQDGFHVNKLYERDGTFSANAVKHAINNGVSIINHMGHSNETIVFGQNSGNAQQYYNNEYGFAYSQGCYPAAFDTATSGDGECVAENMIIASGGLFAFIGNTRYGWYSPGNVWGASEYFDIEFFKAIFDYDIRNLGDANDYSKMELVNMIQTSSVMRWVAYELVVLGDPSLQVKEYNGNFPFLQPASVVYNDVEGDGDGTVNPGETINVEIELENLPNWASANNVYAKIEFANQAVEVIEDSVYYGNINSGSLVESEPFVVGVPQDCNYDSYEYYLRIIAPVGEGNFDRSYTMSFEISLYQENWPVTLSANINSNPIVTDFNADGQLNIVAVDKMGSVSIFDASAQLQSGFPWEYEYNIWKSTAYGDLNNNGQKELVYSSRNNEIVALKPDGDYQFEYFADSGQLFTPVLADINGDGNLEIISSG
ncbi:MAG: C25 family cysteine peptidase, partial [Candidatus Cloacimonadota bacterium]|nr:C25 family cysteine peptidase [Candidatus Cloacimonadota bacterium]